MYLCKICNAANSNAFPVGSPCHICDDRALMSEKMIEEAKALLAKEDAKCFSISTMIPKDWLKNEEDIWDTRMDGSRSIKDHLNKTISAALAKASGLRYVNDGDVKIILDYEQMQVRIERNEIFIFGRYKKLAPGLSQSRWICARCDGKGCAHCKSKGRMYESVEERIGEPFKKACDATDYVMHASGREDVDATNTAGRGFVLEIINPKKREIEPEAIAREIGAGGEVGVQDLAFVGRTFTEVVTESHFDKEYEAEIEFGREIGGKDDGLIRSLAGKTLLQQTPSRVKHRRADIVRHRKVKRIDIARISGNTATISVMAEAGTYIKELISGDLGRTKPSIAEELSTSAKCTKLIVTKIDDGFMDFMLRRKD